MPIASLRPFVRPRHVESSVLDIERIRLSSSWLLPHCSLLEDLLMRSLLFALKWNQVDVLSSFSSPDLLYLFLSANSLTPYLERLG